jgi:hypothetical protein
MDPIVGFCDHNNESSSSVKVGVAQRSSSRGQHAAR